MEFRNGNNWQYKSIPSKHNLARVAFDMDTWTPFEQLVVCVGRNSFPARYQCATFKAYDPQIKEVTFEGKKIGYIDIEHDEDDEPIYVGTIHEFHDLKSALQVENYECGDRSVHIAYLPGEFKEKVKLDVASLPITIGNSSDAPSPKSPDSGSKPVLSPKEKAKSFMNSMYPSLTVSDEATLDLLGVDEMGYKVIKASTVTTNSIGAWRVEETMKFFDVAQYAFLIRRNKSDDPPPTISVMTRKPAFITSMIKDPTTPTRS